MAVLVSMPGPRGGGAFRFFPGRLRWCALAAWLWLPAFGMMGPALARAGPVSHEYPLKAIFLLNFAHFTTWPTNAFAGPKTPFVIGVLGADPFGAALDDAVRDEEWHGHPIAIARYRRPNDVTHCQILFVSAAEARRTSKIMAALEGLPVLSVADADDPLTAAFGIEFLTVNNRIRFRINPASLKDAGLVMSSQLLRVAETAPAQSK